MINAVFDNDTLRFFTGIRILLLEFGFAITFSWALLSEHCRGLSYCRIRSPLTPANSAVRLPKRGGISGFQNLLICNAMTSPMTVAKTRCQRSTAVFAVACPFCGAEEKRW